MENRETPAKYLDFILQKSVDDLKRETKNHLDFESVCKYFDYVKKAGDTLKAVYTLMHIAKMKDTAVYLMFVLKKIKEGAVNFETLDENVREDCEYIKGELVKNFSLSGDPGEEPELKIPEISGSGLSEMVKENRFKVKSEEDESIAEEFSEKEMYDEEVEEKGDVVDDEIQKEEEDDVKMSFGDEEFELISNSEEGDEGFEILDESDRLQKKETEEQQSKSDAEVVNENEDTFKKDDEEDIPYEEMEGEGFVIKKTISETPVEIESQQEDSSEKDNKKENKPEVEEIPEEELEEGYIESEAAVEEVEEPVLIEEKSEDGVEENNESPEKIEELKDKEPNEEIESEKKDEPVPEVSDQYKDYESTLFEVNELIKDYFLDIESVPEGAASPDGEPVIFAKIAELSNIMVNRSEEMSFSIISNVYKNTREIFKEYLETNSRPNEDELSRLNKGISLVEGLIKGDDLPEADDILASLETLRKSFQDTVVEDTSETEAGEEKIIHEEKKEDKKSAAIPVSLKEKYSNAELRESFKQLKIQIQDLENTFQSLDEIEGDYQNYEGLRTLSSTFLNLKEVIRMAKILNLKNVAKLSEASYVFIKFIQNYRMNPFDEDIREIFKYIIYNFKAAALDKPNDDLERFISYLNDPVKIFTQKKIKETKKD